MKMTSSAMRDLVRLIIQRNISKLGIRTRIQRLEGTLKSSGYQMRTISSSHLPCCMIFLDGRPAHIACRSKQLTVAQTCWSPSKRFSQDTTKHQIEQPHANPVQTSFLAVYDHKVSENRKLIELTWQDGRVSRFHSIWLRCHCHCSQCQQDSSGQKLIDVANIPNSEIKDVEVTDDGCLHVYWNESDHEGVFPIDFLKDNCYSAQSLQEKCHNSRLKTCLGPKNQFPTINYLDILNSSEGLLRWLTMVNEDGFCIVKGVPLDKNVSFQFTELVGPLQKTIYGMDFQVESVPNPINVAYSSVGLEFHMDLVYYESPPGLQLLHCIQFGDCVVGGESTILDLFHVAEEFRHLYPEKFQILCSMPTTFQKIHYERDDPAHMVYQRPIIEINHNQQIIAVTWAPQFEGPLSIKEEDVESYYDAYQTLARLIQTSPIIKERRLKVGDVLVFNNRRMLHGRRSFELNGGKRILQGTYVNVDDFKRKLCVMRALCGDKTPVKRVGNHDWQ